MTNGTRWNPAMDARLREMCVEGAYAREIAEALSTPACRITRRAMIGRAFRIRATLVNRSGPPSPLAKAARDKMLAEGRRRGLAKLLAASPPKPRAARPHTRCAGQVRPPISAHERERAFLPLDGAPEPISFMDLREPDCRWPIDCDDGERRYCGLRASSRSYCQKHADMAWRS